MKKNVVIVRGYDFDASNGILNAMYQVAKTTDMKLSDQDYATILDHFKEDGKDELVWEDEVMELMLDSEDFKFTRIKNGFSVYRY